MLTDIRCVLQHSVDLARTAFTPIARSRDTQAKIYVPIAGRAVYRCSINQRKEKEGSSAAGLMSNLRTDTSTLYRCRRIPYGTYCIILYPAIALKLLSDCRFSPCWGYSIVYTVPVPCVHVPIARSIRKRVMDSYGRSNMS